MKYFGSLVLCLLLTFAFVYQVNSGDRYTVPQPVPAQLKVDHQGIAAGGDYSSPDCLAEGAGCEDGVCRIVIQGNQEFEYQSACPWMRVKMWGNGGEANGRNYSRDPSGTVPEHPEHLYGNGGAGGYVELYLPSDIDGLKFRTWGIPYDSNASGLPAVVHDGAQFLAVVGGGGVGGRITDGLIYGDVLCQIRGERLLHGGAGGGDFAQAGLGSTLDEYNNDQLRIITAEGGQGGSPGSGGVGGNGDLLTGCSGDQWHYVDLNNPLKAINRDNCSPNTPRQGLGHWAGGAAGHSGSSSTWACKVVGGGGGGANYVATGFTSLSGNPLIEVRTETGNYERPGNIGDCDRHDDPPANCGEWDESLIPACRDCTQADVDNGNGYCWCTPQFAPAGCSDAIDVETLAHTRGAGSGSRFLTRTNGSQYCYLPPIQGRIVIYHGPGVFPYTPPPPNFEVNAWGSDTNNRYLYIAGGTANVLNIFSRATWENVGAETTAQQALDVIVAGDRAFVLEPELMEVFDVADPGNIHKVAEFIKPAGIEGAFKKFSLSPTHAYLLSDYNIVRVRIDTDDFSLPEEGLIDSPILASRRVQYRSLLTTEDHLLVMGTWFKSPSTPTLFVLDKSTLQEVVPPTPLPVNAGWANSYSVKTQDGTAFIANVNTVEMVDISDLPNSIHRIGSVSAKSSNHYLAGRIRETTIYNNHLYALGWSELHVYAITGGSLNRVHTRRTTFNDNCASYGGGIHAMQGGLLIPRCDGGLLVMPDLPGLHEPE